MRRRARGCVFGPSTQVERPKWYKLKDRKNKATEKNLGQMHVNCHTRGF